MKWLSGYRTYLVAVGMILYEILGWAFGHKPALNMQVILEALGLAALRAGVSKVA